MAAPGVVNWYQRHLLAGINYARGMEYSLSVSIMLVLIAMLTGIINLYALIGLFVVNETMIGLGRSWTGSTSTGSRSSGRPFVLGFLAGALPWITIAIAAAANEGDGVPGFVYGIFVSLFQLFNCFAINQLLQHRHRGRFADYL